MKKKQTPYQKLISDLCKSEKGANEVRRADMIEAIGLLSEKLYRDYKKSDDSFLITLLKNGKRRCKNKQK